jgi:hypothetical protein
VDAVHPNGGKAVAVFMATVMMLRVSVMAGVTLVFLWVAGAVSSTVLVVSIFMMAAVAVALGIGSFVLARRRS